MYRFKKYITSLLFHNIYIYIYIISLLFHNILFYEIVFIVVLSYWVINQVILCYCFIVLSLHCFSWHIKQAIIWLFTIYCKNFTYTVLFYDQLLYPTIKWIMGRVIKGNRINRYFNIKTKSVSKHFLWDYQQMIIYDLASWCFNLYFYWYNYKNQQVNQYVTHK